MKDFNKRKRNIEKLHKHLLCDAYHYTVIATMWDDDTFQLTTRTKLYDMIIEMREFGNGDNLNDGVGRYLVSYSYDNGEWKYDDVIYEEVLKVE